MEPYRQPSSPPIEPERDTPSAAWTFLKLLTGAVFGAISGYAVLFAFTAITGIWFVLLDVVLGLATSAGILLLARDEWYEKKLLFQLVGATVSILTVAVAEYEINRVMFARSGRIDITHYPIVPTSMRMFLDIVVSSVWWTTVLLHRLRASSWSLSVRPSRRIGGPIAATPRAKRYAVAGCAHYFVSTRPGPS